MVRVKICGITDIEALDAVVAAGADFVGLVFYPPSPRHLTLQQASALVAHLRGLPARRPDDEGASAPQRPAVVALVVDADDALLRDIRQQVRPDYIQAHGQETPARVREIAALAQCPVIKAFRLRQRQDLALVEPYLPHIAFPLFDAWHPPQDAALPGGMGRAFDWAWLSGWQQDGGGADAQPFMLAGGLTPENVAEAIHQTGAPMVDVSSGVERARGVKDPALIRHFVQAAHAAGDARK